MGKRHSGRWRSFSSNGNSLTGTFASSTSHVPPSVLRLPVLLLLFLMALDLLNPKIALDLGNIRYTLIRLEDTIVFNLIERAQFPLNLSIYRPGAVPLPNFKGSFLDWLLTEVERTHGNINHFL
jgi:hypothetical protein